MTEQAYLSCSCANKPSLNHAKHIEDFTKIRGACSVLKKLFIPDEVWEKYLEALASPLDVAQHVPYYFGLFMMNALHKITGVAHKYLFERNDLKPQLISQYRADFIEQWILQHHNLLKRHQGGRRLAGRIHELNLTRWLEENGYNIRHLECLGAESDVVAENNKGETFSIELKFIGIEDEFFKAIVDSIRGNPSAVSSLPSDAVNYVLLRIYEAAKQLMKAAIANKKIVTIIFDQLSWNPVGRDLQNNWIDWNNAKFLDLTSKKWNRFFEKQRKKYSQIDEEVGEVLKEMDWIWIFRVADEFELSRELCIKTKS